MGQPNMDFVVRENRAVVKGQMAIIRLGTCGAVQRPAKLGDMLIATHGSISIHRDPDYWTLLEQNASYSGNGAVAANGNGKSNGLPQPVTAAVSRNPYVISLPILGNTQLAALLAAEATRVVGSDRVVEGLNASADSFYSSQVRHSHLLFQFPTYPPTKRFPEF